MIEATLKCDLIERFLEIEKLFANCSLHCGDSFVYLRRDIIPPQAEFFCFVELYPDSETLFWRVF